jgi:hypothetical protein
MRTRTTAIDLPPGLDRAVLKALAPRAVDRHQTAADFRRALERVMKTPQRRTATSRLAGYFAIAAMGLVASVVFGMRLVDNGAGVLHAATARPMAAPSEILTALPSIQTEKPSQVAPIAAAVPVAQEPAVAVAVRKKTARGDGKVAPAVSASARTETVPAAPRAAERDAELERALGASRELAATHPHDARAQQAWAESAAALRDWNEARKAAEAWALVDAGPESRLFMARVLAYGGRKGAAATVLEDLLMAHPECDEARALLSDLGIASVETASERRQPSAAAKETSAAAQDQSPIDPAREP